MICRFCTYFHTCQSGLHATQVKNPCSIPRELVGLDQLLYDFLSIDGVSCHLKFAISHQCADDSIDMTLLIHNEAAQMLRLLTEFIVLFSVFWHTSVPSLYGAYLCVVQFGCFFFVAKHLSTFDHTLLGTRLFSVYKACWVMFRYCICQMSKVFIVIIPIITAFLCFC